MSFDNAVYHCYAWGIKITTPDRVPFVEAAQVVYDKWAPKVGGRERIDAILNFEY